MPAFTTQTGQTGLDAYTFEAAAIANEQRELDARFRRLLTAVHDEAPQVFDVGSDWCPVLTSTDDRAKRFGEYIATRKDRA